MSTEHPHPHSTVHSDDSKGKSSTNTSLLQWVLSVWSRLWDGSWFHYPAIPAGPWETVYGYKPIAKRYTTLVQSATLSISNSLLSFQQTSLGENKKPTILEVGEALRMDRYKIDKDSRHIGFKLIH
jgi:hypothetical protein